DEGKCRIDLQCIEDEGHCSRQTQLEECLPVTGRVGAHQIAFHCACGIETSHRVHQHREKCHDNDHRCLRLPVKTEPHYHDGGDADNWQGGHQIADWKEAAAQKHHAICQNGDQEAGGAANHVTKQHSLEDCLSNVGCKCW